MSGIQIEKDPEKGRVKKLRKVRYVPPPNDRARVVLRALVADRGWHAIDVERASHRPGVGHPQRIASASTVHRVIKSGHTPYAAAQFEIAAVFGLLPSHIWGNVPLPADYDYLNAMAAKS